MVNLFIYRCDARTLDIGFLIISVPGLEVGCELLVYQAGPPHNHDTWRSAKMMHWIPTLSTHKMQVINAHQLA